jgi:transcriptional repressor NrdR
MRCPYCRCTDPKKGTIVIDTREHGDGESIRRRRKCPNCGMRFTTYERVEPAGLRVIKKDGRREDFDRDKLRAKVGLALIKRPVSEERIDALVGEVERELLQRGEREVPSAEIGELVMRHLQQLDEIAYIRFASVYRNFQDLDSLRHEMEALAGARAGARVTAGHD